MADLKTLISDATDATSGWTDVQNKYDASVKVGEGAIFLCHIPDSLPNTSGNVPKHADNFAKSLKPKPPNPPETAHKCPKCLKSPRKCLKFPEYSGILELPRMPKRLAS